MEMLWTKLSNMRNTMPKQLFLLQKSQVEHEVAETGNDKKTAAKWNAYPSTIRNWRKN